MKGMMEDERSNDRYIPEVDSMCVYATVHHLSGPTPLFAEKERLSNLRSLRKINIPSLGHLPSRSPQDSGATITWVFIGAAARSWVSYGQVAIIDLLHQLIKIECPVEVSWAVVATGASKWQHVTLTWWWWVVHGSSSLPEMIAILWG